MKDRSQKRPPVMAAGGIVLRGGRVPLVAVAQMRKYDAWVLPKGKLNDGETPLQAALREVLEETGFAVEAREYLGTLAFEVSGRLKIVQFWRMQAQGDKPVGKLMRDIRAVEWLPLADALERLTHPREREFLRSIAPLAIAAHKAEAAGARAPQPAPAPPPSGEGGRAGDGLQGMLGRLRRWLGGAT